MEIVDEDIKQAVLKVSNGLLPAHTLDPVPVAIVCASLSMIIRGYLESNASNGYSKLGNLEYLLVNLSNEIDTWAHLLERK